MRLCRAFCWARFQLGASALAAHGGTQSCPVYGDARVARDTAKTVGFNRVCVLNRSESAAGCWC